ncbi:beta strand repeat-containing protein [Megamonas funiformis]|uniref:beta strand repeat-containing protein n=1 Tax=Megamonas funiformis TaxID=437897 RepID=UPI0022E7F0E1|nr:hypothetical protein [Megamonas funiformis]
MKIRNKKLLTKSIAMAIFMSSTLYTMPITHAAFNNNTLPDNGTGNVTINSANNIMNISQAEQNAVIQWNDFSIGANATVNFSKTDGGSFNTLNYVNSGKLSQIYGTINADKGNIYIVNPAGVQIGNSAQINVGSLYVSNNLNNDKLKNTFGEITINSLPKSTVSGGELMSLGNINATNVIFDGNRIVLDVDRVKNGQDQLGVGNITIKTTQTDFDNKNVVLGYTAYNSVDKTYKDKNDGTLLLATLEGVKDTQGIEKTTLTKADGFMWVKDGEQLQAMGSNSSGNYAFHNSIDLNSIKDLNSIENFKGNLDGLGYDIYGLHSKNNGLFKNTSNSIIRNFNLISGSINGTTDNVGAVVGNATDTVIENVKNTINVTGANNVGGIIGTGSNVTLNGVVNAGAIKGNSNVGGLAGNLSSSTLNGESYNLGDIKGTVNNIGGLVGSASHSTIGNKTGFQMYNHLDVEGGYNVGGIVGNLENGSTVQNVSNDGNINATDYITGYYNYHTNNQSIVSTADRDNAKLSENEVKVNVANVGGIVGNSNSNKKIDNVLNNGDVSTNTASNSNLEYYIAGNVGGIVGSAVNTDISNATNKENDVRGAHNVGGIVGYFEDGTITKAINNGGDIMATGARNGSDIVKEFVRYSSSVGGNESFIVGNIGGIVGYMYGKDAYINTSANRGTVHTEDIVDESKILDTSKAANVGGIVGKIDREETKTISEIKNDNSSAAINSSYNTGNVRGYTGIGGVAGMMYNGEIVNSYNIGEIRSTRISGATIEPLNMGGIVGDSTEETSAKISLYDVYNKGQIGDEEFVYKGRHVGGIAGRLSGDVDNSYNNGDIYNGATVTGGIAGWWVKGDITNSFNTGNITNYSILGSANGSNVGGIAGGMGIYQTDLSSKLENVYNLGTIRSIKGASNTTNTVGGMIGTIGGAEAPGRLTIENVYTLGNLYSVDNGKKTVETNMIGSYYAGVTGHVVTINNAYYIDTTNTVTVDTSVTSNTKEPTAPTGEIENGNKDDLTKYGGFTDSDDWRIYKGTTPILNAFMPESSKYLGDKNHDGIKPDKWSGLNINDVQYGTAYDPLLTIINAQDSKKNVVLNWTDLGIYGDGGLAVYDSGLTLNNFKNSDKGVGLFGGIIYSDGALNIKSYDSKKNNAENIGLGSFSKIYGSSVTIDAGETGTVDAYGSIISTGNNNIKGDITITGANVNTYGEIKTAVKGQTTTIDGIKGSINDAYDDNIGNSLIDQNAEMPNIAVGYAHTVTAGADSTGNVSITATDGDVNIYYGNMEKGIIDTQGDVSLSGNNVYVDSDMVIGGDLTADTGKNSAGEIVLDISNIGKVSLGQYTDNLYKALKDNNGNLTKDKINEIITNLESVNKIDSTQLDDFINYLLTYVDKYGSLKTGTTESDISDAIIKGRMHNFLKSFEKPATSTENGKYINFAGTDNAKITVDLWDYDNNKFDLNKYDLKSNTLSKELDNLYIKTNGDNLPNTQTGKDFVYIWVADGEQLKGIQDYANENKDSNILSYNFALKNDINATDVKDYQAIGGSGTVFTGKFDGRENRIIGLNVENKDNSKTDNVGVFGTIGEKGIVKNLKVYSSTFKGYDNVGAIAGTNIGTIDNVTTLGNTVEALGSANSAELDSKNVGAAGGVVGTNNGTVNNAISRDSVIAGKDANFGGALTTAGGIAGINTGLVSNSQSHSAVIASGSKDNTYSLGGIVGVNTASDKDQDGNIIKGLDNVNAYGVTGSSILVDNTGGIAGINKGTLHDAYNESIVKGLNNVGGIAGINTKNGDISLIVNGASVTAEGEYTGGLVGSTSGNISNGRNNGVITGVNYVGGLVGSNGKDVILTNLTNDSSANIIGEQYVGGIAGINSGTIKSDEDNDNLINRGSITGNQYVGGIAGENNGTIANVNNDIVLNATGSNAQYFGGVTGINKGTITNATNSGNINASGATYVGGITGQNDGILSGAGNSNEGKVIGKDYVGGVAGLNTENAKITANDDGSVGTEDNIIVIKNEGEVKAEAGGAGGIFGKNEADIQYAEFVNSGKVTGTAGTTGTLSGTGGIFGENTGIIKYSSLKNEVKGEVSGVNNVGGLIGINSGTIEGDRDKDGYYYKYQIYNNGTITATGNGSNIGGLIGYNKNGSLTAGYNTGNIVAGGSNNVGGIVGTNEGTVDQVFNTIMTVDGKNETIDGGSNVGAIIGDNTKGTLTNAYSTTEVNDSVDNLVGTGKENSNDYSKTSIWKTYTKDGNKYKVLKVFLTSVGYDPSNGKKPIFVYNGKDQSVNIDEAIKNGMLTDLSGKKFDAHNAAGLMGSNSHKDADIYTDWLYSGQIASSGKGETFNPNNLGYDIDLATGINDKDKIKIDKAKLTITGNDLDRIYGNTTIQNGGYGITIDGWVNGEDFSGLIGLDQNSITDKALTGNTTGKVTNNAGDYTWTGNIIGSLKNYEFDTTVKGDSKVNKADLVVDLNKVYHTYGDPNLGDYGVSNVTGLTNGDKANIGVTMTKDNALKDNNMHTNNAGENYTWTGNVSGIEGLENNYNITVNEGQSVVNKADLTIDLNENVHHEYGKPNLDDYVITGTEGLTNGDEAFEDKLDVTMTEDTALKDNNTHTNNAGENYTWTGNISGLEGLENNYNITINPGKSKVDKGHLTITVDDSNTTVGDNPSYGGTVDGWVNGDNPNDFDINFGLDDDSIIGQPGKHDGVIGVIIDGTFYPSGTEDDIFNNYDVTINTGDLTVLKPFDIDDSKNWSHLYKDAPWDRNRDFKERKAEFNFVDGAIPLDEAVEEV